MRRPGRATCPATGPLPSAPHQQRSLAHRSQGGRRGEGGAPGEGGGAAAGGRSPLEEGGPAGGIQRESCQTSMSCWPHEGFEATTKRPAGHSPRTPEPQRRLGGPSAGAAGCDGGPLTSFEEQAGRAQQGRSDLRRPRFRATRDSTRALAPHTRRARTIALLVPALYIASPRPPLTSFPGAGGHRKVPRGEIRFLPLRADPTGAS